MENAWIYANREQEGLPLNGTAARAEGPSGQQLIRIGKRHPIETGKATFSTFSISTFSTFSTFHSFYKSHVINLLQRQSRGQTQTGPPDSAILCVHTH